MKVRYDWINPLTIIAYIGNEEIGGIKLISEDSERALAYAYQIGELDNHRLLTKLHHGFLESVVQAKSVIEYHFRERLSEDEAATLKK